jgi:hypothetical protein
MIYTPDGKTVARWDRLGKRSTGDSSHLWHTHLSFFRDSEGRRDRDDNFLGLLKTLIEGTGDDVALNDADAQALIWRVEALVAGRDTVAFGPTKGEKVAHAVVDPAALAKELAGNTGFVNALATAFAAVLPQGQALTAAQVEQIVDRQLDQAGKGILADDDKPGT